MRKLAVLTIAANNRIAMMVTPYDRVITALDVEVVGDDNQGPGPDSAMPRFQERGQSFTRHVRPPEAREARREWAPDVAERERVGDLKPHRPSRVLLRLRYGDRLRSAVRGNDRVRYLCDHARPVAGATGDFQDIVPAQRVAQERRQASEIPLSLWLCVHPLVFACTSGVVLAQVTLHGD